ncbi:hypothetical protein K458DRAFT_135693 [Lentithecium fluviatile CBS 122367]|uniref:Uncharacterized protein n=1 Tax=Lentithecium fluviatile CBS 122367 TaxID=1168545 RepID=A0A6G1IL05_9PLEO|nr:hypothetical protein K458DRAFT_135693 [Lentithecium fluviatile CBS 122367]
MAPRRPSLKEIIAKHHYNNIAKLKLIIAEIDAKIGADYSAGILPETITTYASPYYSSWPSYKRQRRQQCVELLQRLKEGWSKIAVVLREQSKTLFALPRELRDDIYTLLYTSSKAIDIKYVGYSGGPIPELLKLPKDPYLYLNPNIVDPVIASEAAQALYFTNRFNIVVESSKKMIHNSLSHFLNTDHFASNVRPKQIAIRHMNIAIPARSLPFGTYSSHIMFERKHSSYKRTVIPYKDNRKITVLGKEMGPRGQLTPLLSLPHLKHVTLRLTNVNVWYHEHVWHHEHTEFREISPIVKILRRRGIEVRVFTVPRNPSNKGVDVSGVFDEPSEEEVAFVEGNRQDFRVLGRDEQRAWIRVWLTQHFVLFKEREREEKTGSLRRANERIDAVVSALPSLGVERDTGVR